MNEKYLRAAIRQSAIDAGCEPEDFLSGKNKVTVSEHRIGAKAFYPSVHDFLLIRYGSGSVVTVREDRYAAVKEHLDKNDCLSTTALLTLGFSVTSENVCFLPDCDSIEPLPCRYRVEIIKPDGFQNLYLPQWSNALSKKRPQLDKIACGAYDGEKLIGLAGASSDCAGMLQIGIDVLPEYRRRGVASSLTSTLAQEIINLGEVPFYSAMWCNIPSIKNALRSGFAPTWVEIQGTAVNRLHI